jgi:patatin-like phospholipase/acyl hydrolase
MTDIPTYHVLALSGGGYRGLYTATVLAELETALGRPIACHFDLICGTSAGGMLALGLAAEIPAHELKALFEERRQPHLWTPQSSPAAARVLADRKA